MLWKISPQLHNRLDPNHEPSNLRLDVSQRSTCSALLPQALHHHLQEAQESERQLGESKVDNALNV